VSHSNRKEEVMGPDWYFDASERAEENHDPDNYDGREWEELTDEEKDEATMDRITDLADA
jgi:hypothetical protein